MIHIRHNIKLSKVTVNENGKLVKPKSGLSAKTKVFIYTIGFLMVYAFQLYVETELIPQNKFYHKMVLLFDICYLPVYYCYGKFALMQLFIKSSTKN